MPKVHFSERGLTLKKTDVTQEEKETAVVMFISIIESPFKTHWY